MMEEERGYGSAAMQGGPNNAIVDNSKQESVEVAALLTLQGLALAAFSPSKQRKVRIGLAAVIDMPVALVTITSVEEGGGQREGGQEQAADGAGAKGRASCITIGFLISTPTQASAAAVEQILAGPSFASKFANELRKKGTKKGAKKDGKKKAKSPRPASSS